MGLSFFICKLRTILFISEKSLQGLMMQNLCKHLLQWLANEITSPASILLVSTSMYFSHWLLWTNIFDYHPFPSDWKEKQTTRILGWENREESFSIIRISFMTLGKAIYFLCFSFLNRQKDEKIFSLTCLRDENKCVSRESNGLPRRSNQ